MLRVILPVVIDNDEKRVADLVGSTPEKFECEPAVFYSVDNVRPYLNYKNLCIVSSGGDDFIIGMSMEQVDEIIMSDVSFMFSAN
jgi:dTDP-4-amino-4,6-dideoxygalactose transaminase